MEEMSILITNEAKRELDKLLENSDKTCIRILTRHINWYPGHMKKTKEMV